MEKMFFSLNQHVSAMKEAAIIKLNEKSGKFEQDSNLGRSTAERIC